jgi:guanosine-3',5'-bis(diphosphate) 3'-pyrophosphohydrolase
MTINTSIQSHDPWYVTWCIQAHGNQMFGDKPYEYHLRGVAAIAIRFGFVNTYMDMLLHGHDVGEDCINPATGEKYTREDFIAAGFPSIVAEAMMAITDQPGADRDEIKAKTLPIIAAFVVAISADGFCVRRPVVLAKLCDRAFNLAASKANHPVKFKRYQHEHPAFIADLYDPAETEFQPLWDYINGLVAD